MKKIPVGATISRAYHFAFAGFIRILGVIWLPFLIIAAGGLIMLRFTGTPDPAHMGQTLLIMSPLYLLSLFLTLMQITGITELALDQPQGSPYFYFSLGKPVQRVVGAFLLLILLMIGSALPFLACIAALGLLRGNLVTGNIVPGLVVALLLLLCFGAYIYVMVRASFLLIPIAVAEEKVTLRRAWALSRGNFWRIFLILLVVLVPAFIVEIILLFQFVLHGRPTMPPNPTPQQVATYQAAVQAWNAANTTRLAGEWYITDPIYLLFMAVFLGLVSGAQSFAYRAVTEDERAAVEAF